MERVLSSYYFSTHKVSPALLADLHAAGMQAIELFCIRGHFDQRNDAEVRELADWLADHKLAVQSVHAPTERGVHAGRESGVPISICDLERLRRLEAVDEIKRTLDLVEYFPFRFLVQHVGHSRESDDPRKWDAAFNSLEHLAVFAKQRGVTIALENTPGELATPSNLRHFIADTRLHDLRLCFDTGHAHIEAGVAPSFEVMRELVVTTHVHDNGGDKDEHLFPYRGTIDWNAALKLLTGLPLVLELRDPAEENRSAEPLAPAVMLEPVREVFGKLENAFAARA